MLNKRNHDTLLQSSDEGLLRLYGLLRIGLAYILLQLITCGNVFLAPLWYPHSYWTPVSIAVLFGNIPDLALMQWSLLFSVGSISLLGLGAWVRYTGPLAFVFSCLSITIGFSYGKINHNTNFALLMLFVFSFSDWGERFSLDFLWQTVVKKRSTLLRSSHPEWPLQISLLIFSLPYLSTAIFKILKRDFLESGYIPALIKHKQILWDIHSHVPEPIRYLQNLMMAYPWVGDILTYVTLGIELFFFTALFSKEARVFMLAAALILHSSISLMTKIYFLEHILTLAMFLTVALILLFRDHQPLQSLFPRTAPTAIIQKDIWKHPVLVFISAITAVLVMTQVHLPIIPLPRWFEWAKIHDATPLFPINTYLFSNNHDLWISIFAWGYSFIVLCGFAFLFCRMGVTIGVLNKPFAQTVERMLIYDGDCGFCQNWCDWAILHGADQVVRFQSGQSSVSLITDLKLEPDEYMKYSIYIERCGEAITRIEKGAGAINAVLCQMPRRSNMFYRLLGLLYFVDGIKQIQNVGYAWIANNRHRLAPGACTIEKSV